MGKRAHPESSDYEAIAKKFKKLERKLMRARRKHHERRIHSRSSSPSSDTSSSHTSSSTKSASQSPSQRQRNVISHTERPLSIEDVPAIERDIQPTKNSSTDPQPSTSANIAATVLTDSIPISNSTWGASYQSINGVEFAGPRISEHTSDHTYTTHPQVTNTIEVQTLSDLPGEIAANVPVLDNELLQILGENPSNVKIYGKDIQSDLAIRLQHLATNGLSKDNRKELLEKYLIPSNSTLIDAPVLNPEVRCAITETIYKRDKGIEQRQKQLASGISCIAEALTLLLSSEPKNTILIQLLMDALKLLCDNQNTDSVVRRNFVLFNLKKELKDQLQATKIDKFLFSQELADTLKAAKAISRSGAEMKINNTTKSKPPKKTNTQKQTYKNLNWKGPPPSYRPKGTQRTTKDSAYKSRHDNTSTPSSQPAQRRRRQ